MSHFAEIVNGTVVRVIVADGDGPEAEAAVSALLGGTWKQTSYTGRIRGNFAGEGMRYDPERDAFLHPQPFPSWVLGDDHRWHPPTPMPDGCGILDWDEDTRTWRS